MIIWLASYPRSGNTLLRTILKRCLDIDSYADEPIHVESPLRSDNELIGHLELDVAWPQFHARSAASRHPFFVKTHLPPRDAERFIYVIRDGRSAVKSYEKYYERYVPAHKVNLFRLIAGDDAYGDWSSHYRAWNDRPGAAGLLLRFEELTDVSAETLRRIADFVGHRGPVVPWTNPFDDLARAEPGFFREGRTQFRQEADWSDLVNDFFNHFHAELMGRLGYPVLESRSAPSAAALFGWARELVQRNRELMGVCDERLALINSIHEEAEKRLELINALSRKAAGGGDR